MSIYCFSCLIKSVKIYSVFENDNNSDNFNYVVYCDARGIRPTRGLRTMNSNRSFINRVANIYLTVTDKRKAM